MATLSPLSAMLSRLQHSTPLGPQLRRISAISADVHPRERNPASTRVGSQQGASASSHVWGQTPRQHLTGAAHGAAKLAPVAAVADGRAWETQPPSSAESAGARAGEEYFQSDVRPVVLYDGVCNFCNAGVNFVLDNDKTGKLRLAALQSRAGQILLQRSGRAADDISSIVLVEKDKSYTKSEAVLKIGQLLDVPLAYLAPLALLSPRVIGDSLYDVVASNRYNILGKRDECRLDDATFRGRFLAD